MASNRIGKEPTFDRGRIPSAPFTFSASDLETLLDKIASKRNFELNGNAEIAQGIVPNPDVVSSRSLQLIPEKKRAENAITAGQGVFVVAANHFGSPNKSETHFLKPLYEPTDVGQYAITRDSTKAIIYSTRSNAPNETLPMRLKNHLVKYREIMEERRENKQGRIDFSHLHWPRNVRFFEQGEKILAVRKCEEPTFAYTESEAYVMMSFNIIKTDRVNLLYLTALLNSRLVRFWLKHRGKMQGQNFQVDKEPLLAIPLCVPEKTEQERLAKITKRIIECKQKMAGVTTDSAQMQLQRSFEQFEAQLDDAIETLYGLDESERALIQLPI